MEEILDFFVIIFIILLVSGFLLNYFESCVEFDSYFLAHYDEFTIIDFYIGNTRFGSNSYHVIAKHIATNKIYDYHLNINDYVRFGGVLVDAGI